MTLAERGGGRGFSHLLTQGSEVVLIWYLQGNAEVVLNCEHNTQLKECVSLSFIPASSRVVYGIPYFRRCALLLGASTYYVYQQTEPTAHSAVSGGDRQYLRCHRLHVKFLNVICEISRQNGGGGGRLHI